MTNIAGALRLFDGLRFSAERRADHYFDHGGQIGSTIPTGPPRPDWAA